MSVYCVRHVGLYFILLSLDHTVTSKVMLARLFGLLMMMMMIFYYTHK